MFLLALGLTLYPVISNFVNQKYASEIFTAYQEVISQTDNSVLVQEREKAIAYTLMPQDIVWRTSWSAPPATRNGGRTRAFPHWANGDSGIVERLIKHIKEGL